MGPKRIGLLTKGRIRKVKKKEWKLVTKEEKYRRKPKAHTRSNFNKGNQKIHKEGRPPSKRCQLGLPQGGRPEGKEKGIKKAMTSQREVKVPYREGRSFPRKPTQLKKTKKRPPKYNSQHVQANKEKVKSPEHDPHEKNPR